MLTKPKRIRNKALRTTAMVDAKYAEYGQAKRTISIPKVQAEMMSQKIL